MASLHELLGRRAGVRARVKTVIDDAYKRLQRPALFTGGTKRYTPLTEEDGTTYPDQDVVLQLSANFVLRDAASALAELFNITMTVDEANAMATSDIIVNGEVIYPNVPAVTLIAVEKRLTDLHTMIAAAPGLDPAERWFFDPATSSYRSATPVETLKMKKVTRYTTVFAGDQHHAPDIRERTEDVPVGKWTSVNLSGGLSAEERAKLLRRVDLLRQAAREARERANSMRLTSDGTSDLGEALMGHIF